MADAPKYRVLQDSFFEPHFIKEGAIIEFDGEPGPHLEALNEPARVLLAAYYETHPEASLNPVEQLPITPGANPRPSMTVVGQAQPDELRSFVDMSDKDKPAKIGSLAEVQSGVKV